MSAPHLKVTRAQALLMLEVDLGQKLGVNPGRPMLLEIRDCEEILRVLPYSSGRDGNEKRTTRALRQRVIRLRGELERLLHGE